MFFLEVLRTLLRASCSEGARDETEAFPNSCHKAVKSIEEGLLFRRDYRTTTAIVNKLRSGEEDPAQALEELISKLRL